MFQLPGTKMNFERSIREFALSKRIPLHYQKSYLANFSNGSFNVTFRTGVYKNKIKTLLKNNRLLALALQKDRLKNEELLAESKANADLIIFSRLKLTNMSENLKKVASSLDETLSLLEKHSTFRADKCTPKSTMCREEFKTQLKEFVMEPISEQSEPSEPKDRKTTKAIELCPVKNQLEDIVPSSNNISPKAAELITSQNSRIRNLKLQDFNGGSKEMLVKNSPLKDIQSGKKFKTSALSKKRKPDNFDTKDLQELPLQTISNNLGKDASKSKPVKKNVSEMAKLLQTKVTKSGKETNTSNKEATEKSVDYADAVGKLRNSTLVTRTSKQVTQTEAKNKANRRSLKALETTDENVGIANSSCIVRLRKITDISNVARCPPEVINTGLVENDSILKSGAMNITDLSDELPYKKIQLFQQDAKQDINLNSEKKKVSRNISSKFSIANFKKKKQKGENSYPIDDLIEGSKSDTLFSGIKIENKSNQRCVPSEMKSLILNKTGESDKFRTGMVPKVLECNTTERIVSDKGKIVNLAKNEFFVFGQVNSCEPDYGHGKSVEQKNCDDKAVTSMEEHSLCRNDELKEPSDMERRKFRKRPSNVCYKELPSNAKMRR